MDKSEFEGLKPKQTKEEEFLSLGTTKAAKQKAAAQRSTQALSQQIVDTAFTNSSLVQSREGRGGRGGRGGRSQGSDRDRPLQENRERAPRRESNGYPDKGRRFGGRGGRAIDINDANAFPSL